jgi:parvulin-like peptidyl-prolyl isomerase
MTKKEKSIKDVNKSENKKKSVGESKKKNPKKEKEEPSRRKNDDKKNNRKIRTATFFLVILFLLIFLGLGFYFYSPLNNLNNKVFRYFSYPVVVVNKNKVITSKELIADTEAVKKFYESQDFSSVGMRIDFETKEGELRGEIKEKDVLDKLVEDEIIRDIAKKNGIVVTKEEAQNEIQQKIQEFGDTQALIVNLEKLYGWDLDEFRDKIVIPQIYLQKLIAFYLENEQPKSKSYLKIKQAREELKEDNSNFGELAKKYSDGSSASNEGELGWFKKEQLVTEVAEAVYNIEPGKSTVIIQSTLGYHIVFLEGTRKVENEEGDEVMEVNLKQIFVRGDSFLDWLNEQKKESSVWVMLRKYQWDRDYAQVRFRDEKMRKIEKDLKMKSEGDPSMNNSL